MVARESSEYIQDPDTTHLGALNREVGDFEETPSLGHHSLHGDDALEPREEVDARDQDFYAGHQYKITTKKFENNELCAVFLGRWGKLAYECTLFLFSWGGMWSYAAVFATSTATFVPLVGYTQANQCQYPAAANTPADEVTLCGNAYYIWMAIFACIVLPVSCLEMTEQWIIQVTLTCYRFLALTLMIITTYLAMFTGPYKSYGVTESPPWISTDRSFRWAGFSSVFSTAVFAQMMHHSVPGLAQHVDRKSKLRTMFFSGFTTTFCFYSVLGILCSLYFGPGVEPLVTLNWTSYTGLTFNGSLDYSVGAKIISYLIVLFPVFDISSA
ncbi:MAG: hypothetical protein Q8P67_06340, partial [archaeon]|nr:hypothetical protein [archaeon]